MKQNNHKPSYLDVSELLLKELSPVFKPISVSKPKQNSRQNQQLAPQVSPVLQAKMNFIMTPVFETTRHDPFKDSSLQQLEGFSLDGSLTRRKSKKSKRGRSKSDSTFYIFNNELQNIIEENNSEDYSEDIFSESDEEDENCSDEQISDDDEEESEDEHRQGEPERQSSTHFDGLNYQFKSAEWQCANPKKQLVGKLRQVVNNQEGKSDAQKIVGLKQVIQKYLCEHQKFYFEDSISSLKKQEPSVSQMLGILVKGIDQTFKRTIGGLIFEKRRIKLLRYLDKKKRRVWRKKVSYDCRKKVADGRLRIKGKFVTIEQAREQLGLSKDSFFSPEQIKQMLYKKLEGS